jgi:MarR family transcriptional regulator, organic hydroperoxide resistance regulator
VTHAEWGAAKAREEAAMAWCPIGEQLDLDQEIFDVMAGFLGELLQHGDQLAKEFGIPLFCIKALHRLGSPVTMKELGGQLHVDRSFVTMIADTLEERGLARREPHPADRRIKNLVLTPEGMTLKGRLEAALTAQMPWSHTLDLDEKANLLKLIRKMTKAGTAPATPADAAADTSSLPSGDERAGGVTGPQTTASLAA